MNTPIPNDPGVDTLINKAVELLFYKDPDMGRDAVQERATVQQAINTSVNRVGNQQRFMLYWLLQSGMTGPQRAQMLQGLVPHCANAMKPDNTTRVKLAAAHMLHEVGSLSETQELIALQEAEKVFHTNPDALAQDASLRTLAHWALCLLSDNADDLRAILQEKSGNRNTQLIYAIGAINNLSWEDICTIVEEQSEHFQNTDADRNTVASFCARGIRRLLQTSAHMNIETDTANHAEYDELQDKEGDAVRVTTAIETLLSALADIPEAATQIASAHYKVAMRQWCTGDLEEALFTLQEAKIACPDDEKHRELLTAIDVAIQNVQDEMGQEGQESDS